DLLAGSEEERLTRADGGAHRLLPHRGAIVAEIALHHQVHPAIHLRNPEGTRENAVVARDAAWLPRALHHPVARALDRVGGTDLRARRRVAVHTHHGHRLWRMRAIDVVQLDHRMAPVRVTLGTCLHTRVAPDAAVRIDEELERLGN